MDAFRRIPVNGDLIVAVDSFHYARDYTASGGQAIVIVSGSSASLRWAVARPSRSRGRSNGV